MAKELKFVLLLDCYGDLLTEHQRNVMELYYCEDLSLAEIASPLGITRQAVRSLIKRTEDVLINYEDKLGFACRIQKMRGCFERINQAVQGINDEKIRKIIADETDFGLGLL
ncbi:MAG: YlxM family DNA-binding protein [Ruminococcus flavefaciens]|nr:YlxM family DNA-binding protein [Ruminococcus flavefaciens]MCM1228657.1 YlxM family DNA-binding protein [Ruminococcus flavefaciens]